MRHRLQMPQQKDSSHENVAYGWIPTWAFQLPRRSGKVDEIIGRILETIKPETAYFIEQDGKRGGIFVNVQTPSDVPAFAEPFFLNFQASCKFRILMSPEDLQKAGLEELGKKWAWMSLTLRIKRDCAKSRSPLAPRSVFKIIIAPSDRRVWVDYCLSEISI